MLTASRPARRTVVVHVDTPGFTGPWHLIPRPATDTRDLPGYVWVRRADPTREGITVGAVPATAVHSATADTVATPVRVLASLVTASGPNWLAGPRRELRAQRLHTAERRALGVSDFTPAAELEREMNLARCCEDRDEETWARAVLAHYAAQLDQPTDLLDRTAARFAAPLDDEQVAAGYRLAEGTTVTVDSMPGGAWQVLHRTVAEQRRYPYQIRVRMCAGMVEGSVPLGDVQSITPPDRAPAVGRAWWRAVDLGWSQRYTRSVYAGGEHVGELWSYRDGSWRAHRHDVGAPLAASTTPEAALGLVRWLGNERAIHIHDAVTTVGPRLVVLPDGAEAEVVGADVHWLPRSRHPRGDDRAYRSTLAQTVVLHLRRTGRVYATGLPAGDRGTDLFTVRLRANQSLPVTAPCPGCGAGAGIPHTDSCSSGPDNPAPLA